MNINKILTYLGFCPGKESAQNFETNTNTIEEKNQKWRPYRKFLSYTGVLLVFTGLVPFFFEDTSITGVTETILLHGKIGITCFLLGISLIIYGILYPKISYILRKTGV